jgi:hypothetical protein
MTKIGPDVYSVATGDVIQIYVQSVNFVINADFDPKLTTVGPVNDFSKTGQLTISDGDTDFSIGYNFPNPLPTGGKYTRTITGPGGFTDGPFDVLQPGNQGNVTLPYIVKLRRMSLGK